MELTQSQKEDKTVCSVACTVPIISGNGRFLNLRDLATGIKRFNPWEHSLQSISSKNASHQVAYTRRKGDHPTPGIYFDTGSHRICSGETGCDLVYVTDCKRSYGSKVTVWHGNTLIQAKPPQRIHIVSSDVCSVSWRCDRIEEPEARIGILRFFPSLLISTNF